MFENPQCENCLFKSPATKNLDIEQIGQLEQNCAVANLKKGDVIFKQGIFSSNIVYLKEGIVKLFVDGPNTEQILRIVKGPTYLGIPTTLNEKFNRYSAKVLEDVNACFINIETFKSFVQDNGKFAYEIILELCKSELDLFKKYMDKSQKNARGRIADALLFFKDEIYETDSYRLPLTRNELGDYVNATRESVSRILTEFHNEKIIKVKGREISILNEKRLNIISKTG